MSKFVKLKDLCIKITDGSHFSPKGIDVGIPMLSVKDMRENCFDYSDCKKISQEDYEVLCSNGCHPEVNDIVIAKDGSYLKQVFVIKEDIKQAVLSSIGILKPDLTKVNPYYIKYYLSSDFVKNEVAKKYVSGSALPRIILKGFANIEIPYIDKKLQDKLISILKNIDDKIANNNKTNAQLEEMAKTIYDYWFLQFEFPNEEGKAYKSSGGKMVWNDELKREIPEGWKIGQLSDISQIIMGSSPKGESLNENNEGIIFYQGKTDFGKRFPTVRMYTNKPIRYAEVNSILLSVRAPVGDINITNKKCCIGRGLAAISGKYQSFLFYHMLANKYQFDKYNNSGTTFGALTKDNLYEMKIIIPEEKIIRNFNNLVKKYDDLIKKNFEENCTLEEMRDFLLPLLMNGQVKFKDTLKDEIAYKEVEEKESTLI